MKRLLLATTALFAIATAAPAFAGSGGSGDDSATISQVGETGGAATQHQPGDEGNTQTINQAAGVNDTASQEQWRDNSGVDFAVAGQQTITQTANSAAHASQTDNSFYGVQSITQIGNTNNTSATQTINEPFGGQTGASTGDHQTATQTANNASTISQTIGTNAASVTADNSSDVQKATQTGQVNSSITQTINGGNNDQQTASETGVANFLNTISQTSTGSNDTQNASISLGSNNSITQLQGAASNTDVQNASVTGGNNNLVDQLQDAGSANDTQTVTVLASNNGRALQYQGVGVVGGSETITQNLGGFNNQAGQGQGDSLNTATITQSGGANNVAIQNQGLLPGQTGYMHLVGSTVVRTP